MHEYVIVRYRYNVVPMRGLDEDFGDDTLFSIVPRRGGEGIGRRGVVEMVSRRCTHNNNIVL